MNFIDSYTQLRQSAQSGKPAFLSWLPEKQKAAIEAFKTTGLPSRKNEDWKHAHLSILESETYQWPRPVVGLADLFQDPSLYLWDMPTDLRCVFLNGHHIKNLSTVTSMQPQSGLYVFLLSEFAQFAEQHPEIAKKMEGFVQSKMAQLGGAMDQLNRAFTFEALIVYLAPEVKAAQPLLLLNALKGDHLGIYPSAFVYLEQGAQLTVNHVTATCDAQHCLVNEKIEVHLEAEAQLSFNKLAHGNSDCYVYSNLAASLLSRAKLTANQVTFGGKMTRQDVAVDLNGVQGEAHLNAVYLAKHSDRVANHACIQHKQGDCISRQNYKGVIADQAKAVFAGTILVHEGADLTDSAQVNKNLLLSPHAEVVTEPRLEIYADDVKAAHGATVGQLNPEELFYLMSRAIDRSTAQHMLSRAFAEDILFEVEDTTMRERLSVLCSLFLRE